MKPVCNIYQDIRAMRGAQFQHQLREFFSKVIQHLILPEGCLPHSPHGIHSNNHHAQLPFYKCETLLPIHNHSVSEKNYLLGHTALHSVIQFPLHFALFLLATCLACPFTQKILALHSPARSVNVNCTE
jgi:hypothetical protein